MGERKVQLVLALVFVLVLAVFMLWREDALEEKLSSMQATLSSAVVRRPLSS